MAAKDGSSFPDRARFMGYASRVMRGLIIDHARNRSALKRGGQFHITSSGTEAEKPADDRELVQIGEALDELARAEPSLAEIVDMKFFCGFTFEEIGALKGIFERTAQRQWEKARIYLHRTISADLDA
jgi:RNA polymerase sigma factor (TIGR02999 family)